MPGARRTDGGSWSQTIRLRLHRDRNAIDWASCQEVGRLGREEIKVYLFEREV